MTVTDQGGQNPPTAFNNVPVEQAISMVVDVWGLNIYSGISSDFPIYQKNVVDAAKGKYARPLWVTEWGTPAATCRTRPRPTTGNAQAEQLSSDELTASAQQITAEATYMQTNLGFVAGATLFRIHRRVVEKYLLRSHPGGHGHLAIEHDDWDVCDQRIRPGDDDR